MAEVLGIEAPEMILIESYPFSHISPQYNSDMTPMGTNVFRLQTFGLEFLGMDGFRVQPLRMWIFWFGLVWRFGGSCGT